MTTQGKKLAAWREQAKLTHIDVCGKLGVSSPSVVSRLERDKYVPGLHLALDIEAMTEGAVKAVDWPRKPRKHEKRVGRRRAAVAA